MCVQSRGHGVVCVRLAVQDTGSLRRSQRQQHGHRCFRPPLIQLRFYVTKSGDVQATAAALPWLLPQGEMAESVRWLATRSM